MPYDYTNGAAIAAAEDLLTCLEQAVADITSPPRYSSLRSGAAIALDLSQTQNECCDGLAWVRLGDEFPGFPTQDENPNPCDLGVWSVELEMGVARCAPVGDIQDTPTFDEHYALARLLAEDSAAMRRALCCFKPQLLGQMQVGRFTKFGPEGGCVGTIATVTVQTFPRVVEVP